MAIEYAAEHRLFDDGSDNAGDKQHFQPHPPAGLTDPENDGMTRRITGIELVRPPAEPIAQLHQKEVHHEADDKHRQSLGVAAEAQEWFQSGSPIRMPADVLSHLMP